MTKLQNRDKLLPPEKDWWDQILDDHDTVLNPVPNAFEGSNAMLPPTREEFQQRFQEDVAMLRSEFPNVQVLEYNDFAFDGVYQMVADVASGNAAENNFLVAIAPLIHEGVKKSERRSVEQQILETANAFGLRSHSFSLYTSLSCLYSSAAEKQIAQRRKAGIPGYKYPAHRRNIQRMEIGRKHEEQYDDQVGAQQQRHTVRAV